MENIKKINVAIFFNNKIIAVQVCKTEAEANQVIEENKVFGYETQIGFYHFDSINKLMTWRSKGHSNRSKNSIKHQFEKSLIKTY